MARFNPERTAVLVERCDRCGIALVEGDVVVVSIGTPEPGLARTTCADREACKIRQSVTVKVTLPTIVATEAELEEAGRLNQQALRRAGYRIEEP